MTYQPYIPATGLVGWQFLQSTYDNQLEAFSASGQVQSDIEYFEENIGKIAYAEDFVADRRLMQVALGAFGLQNDLDNTYFIQRILSDGTEDDDALANKLADDRYKEFSAAFGFGPLELPKTFDKDAMAKVAENFRLQSFEQAVGAQDETMRIALYGERELTKLVASDKSDDALWFTIMGQPPLRQMFETAFGLPPSFGQIDIDQQLGVFRERARSVLGDSSVQQFSDPDALDKLVTIYQARSQINAGAGLSGAATALQLLSSF